MKSCQKCNSDRIVEIYGKCSDLSSVSYKGYEKDGYVQEGIGIGGGDDINFKYCLECGQIQGKFPLAASSLEKARLKFLEREEQKRLKEEARLDANRNFDMDKFFSE